MRNRFAIPTGVILLLAAASVQADFNCAGGMDATGNECTQVATAAAQSASATKRLSAQRLEAQVRTTQVSLHSQLQPIKSSVAPPVRVAKFEPNSACAGHSSATGNNCE